VQFFKSTVTVESYKQLLEQKFSHKKRGLVRKFHFMQEQTQEVLETIH